VGPQLARALAAAACVIAFGLDAFAQPAAPPGAAACSGCHGRAGGVPPINGRDANELAAAMRDFRSGQRAATVMDRIAKGFSDDETRAIASWLAAQR
jgi:sulfide dehydrogenase cytochrome subunit